MSMVVQVCRHMLPRPKMLSGFTLLEILIALTIISILAMVAIPYYQDYRTRVRVASEIGIMSPVKNRVLEEFQVMGAWPTSNAAAQLGDAADYHGEWVASVEVGDVPVDGAITITYDNSKLAALGANNTIVFYPQANGGSVSWACDGGSMVNEFRPHNCRD